MSWNQLLYSRVIEVCRLPFEHVMTSSCTSSSSSNFFPARCFFRRRNKWKSLGARFGLYGGWSNISHLNFSWRKSYEETHLAIGGLTIGAAITNTSHSYKAGSTIVKRARLTSKGGRCVRLTTLPQSCAVVMKSGNLNFLEPSRPLQACNGTALLLQK